MSSGQSKKKPVKNVSENGIKKRKASTLEEKSEKKKGISNCFHFSISFKLDFN